MDVSLTGLDGLAGDPRTPPDVVLLDMHLPDISGMEVPGAAEGRPGHRRIPVVIVSADALVAQIDAALDAGRTAT
jgi:CheY-like chemotaxis protein